MEVTVFQTEECFTYCRAGQVYIQRLAIKTEKNNIERVSMHFFKTKEALKLRNIRLWSARSSKLQS